MIYPDWGPFLFDTSAESRLDQPGQAAYSEWVRKYTLIHAVHISAATVMERIRGYGALWLGSEGEQRRRVEAMRDAYLSRPVRVVPIDEMVAAVAGEIQALVPSPPTPPRHSHSRAESRQDRLTRWRFDAIIAATALAYHMPLVHDNAADFEAIHKTVEQYSSRFGKLGPVKLIRYTSLV